MNARRPASRDRAADDVDAIIGQWRSQRPDLDCSTIGVFGRISRLAIVQASIVRHLHEQHGLSAAAFDVLASLRRIGPPYRETVGELAASSLLTSGAVSLRLDNLEADGLVRRVRLPGDRRVVYAELTGTGLTKIDEVYQEHIALEHRMLDQLRPGDRDLLAELLAGLSASMRSVAEEHEIDER